MGTASPTRRLLDHLTSGRFGTYVADRRNAGKSWRQVSLDIRDDFAIDVTHETLRNWFPDDRRASDEAVSA